jgi:hypothetical protein
VPVGTSEGMPRLPSITPRPPGLLLRLGLCQTRLQCVALGSLTIATGMWPFVRARPSRSNPHAREVAISDKWFLFPKRAFAVIVTL